MTPQSDASPEVDQPGLRQLREAVAYAQRELPRPATIRQDAVAGLNCAVTGVPDGMASGLLAGVSPVYGLYASMIGPIVGALFSSTRLMVVTTTSASALAAGQALVNQPVEDRADSLFMMVLLIGACQVVFGLLKLGRLTRFVSYPVMTGFLAGVSVLAVLSQLPAIAGYAPTGENRVSKTIDLFAHVGEFNWASVGVAAFGLALAVGLPRTKLGNLGMLVAIVVPSIAVIVLGMSSVEIVKDLGSIPRGVPRPDVPSVSVINADLLTAAPAIAAIILVQGSGVSQTVPNPDGSRRRMSRDFIAVGIANGVSGLFRGLPVGPSLATTALSVVSGARTRWAATFSGLFVGVSVIVFPGVVARVAMPALAALLIVASVSTLKPWEALSLWNTGWGPRLASVTTFLSMLFLPIQLAVGIGVALSALLYLLRSASGISVVELVERPDGQVEERKPGPRLASGTVTVLDVYGQLFFAAARTLERLLPEPRGSESAVVVLRLRGHKKLGATLIHVLSTYSARLEEAGGRLYLSGVTAEAHAEAVRSDKLDLSGPVRIYEATSIVGQSTREAHADATAWLVAHRGDPAPAGAAAGDPAPDDATR